jgi:undecaprenyl-diphosphatase
MKRQSFYICIVFVVMFFTSNSELEVCGQVLEYSSSMEAEQRSDCQRFHSIDTTITFAVNRINSSFASTLSQIFDKALIPVAIITPITLFALGQSKDNIQMAETGTLVFTAGVITYGAVWGLKRAVGRLRPYKQYPHIVTQRAEETSYSFPSGHAAGSAVIGTVLSLQYPHWYVIIPSALYSISTSVSRLYLGVHFFSDIIVGTLVGVSLGTLVYSMRSQVRKVYRGVLPETPPLIEENGAIVRIPLSDRALLHFSPQRLTLSWSF